MKEEVERKKDEVRNMTMMLVGGDDDGGEGVGNLLDELEEHGGSSEHIEHHAHSERSTLSIPRLSKLNMSKLNTSITNQQGMNTTLNFIKSTSLILTKCNVSCSRTYRSNPEVNLLMKVTVHN